MAVNAAHPLHAQSAAKASHSAASAIGAPRAGAHVRARADADADADGGFAAQLLRAQPQDHDAPKPDKDASAKDQDGDQAAKDGRKDGAAADGAPRQPDPSTLLPWPPQAQTTAALAAQSAPADADGPADPLAALRKGAGKGKDGKEALAALALGQDGQAAGAAAALGAGKGAPSAGDFAAVLGKGQGAGNSATGTRDGLAALLPQADPATVQAGAIGAAPSSTLQADPAPQPPQMPPAQATLPMPPQAPTFAPALGHQIDVWMKGGVQHAEVQLTPQDLGPIRVRIEMDGVHARVEMAADVPSTRDALQQALPQLSDQLGQVGLSLAGGGVSDQSASQSQAQAFAMDGGGQGRSGRGAGAGGHGAGQGGAGGLEDVAAASAAHQAAQRRGLLDMYA
jgi:flagellar hook-length control protein FliK